MSALRIGVRVPRRFDDAGEYLADARALDAAGADSLWLDDDGHDPWLLLASIAAVTGRVRLVVPVTAADGRALPDFEARLITLNRLSRGRVVAGLAVPVHSEHLESLVVAARRCDCPVIAAAAGALPPHAAGLLADGMVGLDDSPAQLRGAVERVRQAREEAGRKEPCELWARTAMPRDPAQWRTTRAAWEAAGATGLIVPADPRLLDLLRNGDVEDDRSDLGLAQG